MHLLKLALLLIVLLLVMRSVSWLLGWLSFRFLKLSRILSTIVGNTLAFCLFVGLLVWNQMPGEPFDVEAVIFGAVVFGFCQLLDLKWGPWGRT